MKKKVNIFGKSIPVFVFVLLGMGVVAAALVPYLSGMITGLVTASSPMTMEISDDETTWKTTDPLDLGTMHGGGEITFYARTKNLAIDKSITGLVENIVTSAPVNGHQIDCDDFESVILTTISTYTSTNPPSPARLAELNTDPKCTVDSSGLVWTCGTYDLIALPLCTKTGVDTVKFNYGPNPIVWAAEQVDVTTIVMTFEVNAVGNYELTSQVVPVPVIP